MKVLIAVATWFIYSTVVFGSRRNLPFRVGHPDSPKVIFYADSYDQNTYNEFIDNLRDALKSDKVSYDIPVLRATATVGDERYVLVELASTGNHRIVALDANTAGVVGFISENEQSYFFSDVPDDIYNSSLFEGTSKHRLPYAGTYTGLEVAGAYREQVQLGIFPLNDAILNLTNYATSEVDIAPSLLVVIQMVTEAARLDFVRYKLTNSTNFLDGFYPKPDVTSLEDQWDTLSFAIQLSNNGIFDQVELRDENNNPFYVSHIAQIKVFMGLLKATAIPIPDMMIRLLSKLF